jgi:hypothetical protein
MRKLFNSVYEALIWINDNPQSKGLKYLSACDFIKKHSKI